MEEANRLTTSSCSTTSTVSPTLSASVIPPTLVFTTTSFIRNLSLGSTGSDVKALQIFLNTHGFTVATSGNGSPSHESTYFGSATKTALIKFQSAHNILATGYFGMMTRRAIEKEI
jgi:peptidoglycan hydrolase-like protein with peptidoglycan-binding domain